jgi:hypothetical protein
VAAVDVLEHQAGGWFLLVEDGRHYLDVNCSLPMVSVDIILRLDADEEAELHALGRTFVDYLAAKVAYWPDRYRARDLSREINADVGAAVERWRVT